MSSQNPYSQLPATAFWKSAVVEVAPESQEGIYSKKFEITRATRIATAGSCFAQHIDRHLRRSGYAVLDVEPAPAWLPPSEHHRFGFSMYSARYGNIYTAHQLLQLAKEANGEFEPQDIAWMRDGKVFDALRPAVEPDGLDDEAEVHRHRRHHLTRVRQLFREMEVFIFTLGLTEAWVHRASGAVFPTAPGVIAGTFDEATYTFANFGFADIERAFDEFLEVLARIRGAKPPPNILLTVSPVPLTATASGQHVLPATAYSKAVLRAFAGHASANKDHVAYFPSYEIVTNPSARGAFFESNLRSVKPEGVKAVLDVFFRSHGLQPGLAADGAHPVPDASARRAEAVVDETQCEEAILEGFAK